MRIRNLTIPLAAFAVVAACGGGDTEPTLGAAATPATPADLDGRVLVATGATEDGAERPFADGTTITVSFEEPGSIGVSGGCNTMFGAYSLEDGILTADALASTMMACEEARMEQDAWIGALLSEGVAVGIEGDAVTFSGGSTVVTFADRAAVAPATLTGATWTLTDLITVGGSTVTAAPDGVVATLTFADDGTYQVDTGCNTGGGTATIGDTTIDFGMMRLTRRACVDDAAQQVEAAVTTALDGEVEYDLADGFLRLLNGEEGLGYAAG